MADNRADSQDSVTPTAGGNQVATLIEQLAAIEHERWSDWQRWCHQVLRENNPSPEIGDILERWDRQIETPYADLSEAEKQSDRDQVMRYWPLIQEWVNDLATTSPEATTGTANPPNTDTLELDEILELFRKQCVNKTGGQGFEQTKAQLLDWKKRSELEAAEQYQKGWPTPNLKKLRGDS